MMTKYWDAALKYLKQGWECFRGHHQWIELRSEKRSLFMCQFCGTNHLKEPEHYRE